MAEPAEKIRVDKWLWHARFFKTRSLAAKVVATGHVRINGNRVAKPSVQVSASDILTFPQAKQVRVVKLTAIGTRRGPAPEAQALYEDLTPPPDPKPVPSQGPVQGKYDGGGRPTKRDRRKLDQSRSEALE